MRVMLTNRQIVDFIETHAKRLNIGPTTFCKRAVNDGGVYRRLLDNKPITTKTAQALQAYAEANP